MSPIFQISYVEEVTYYMEVDALDVDAALLRAEEAIGAHGVIEVCKDSDVTDARYLHTGTADEAVRPAWLLYAKKEPE